MHQKQIDLFEACGYNKVKGRNPNSIRLAHTHT